MCEAYVPGKASHQQWSGPPAATLFSKWFVGCVTQNRAGSLSEGRSCFGLPFGTSSAQKARFHEK